MRYHVLGVGSVGSLFAWNLRKITPLTSPISLIIKSESLKKISHPRQPVISVDSPEGGTRRPITGFHLEVLPPPHLSGVRDIGVQNALRNRSHELVDDEHPPYGYIHSLFVSTKAHQAPSAITSLAEAGRVTPYTTIVLLMNGMGIYEHLVSTTFADPATRPHFILATNTHGVWQKGPLNIVHASQGNIHWAIVPDSLGRDQQLNLIQPSTPESLQSNLIPPSPSIDPKFISLHRTISALDSLQTTLGTRQETISHLHARILQKLVVNCCVNPLTAIKNCTNGDLYGNPFAHQIINQVCDEAAEIFRRTIEAEPDEADGPFEFRPPPTAGDLEEEVLRVIRLTSKNYSSMLQDVRRKKPTEIEYLNGYLSRLGKEYDVPTPTIDMLANIIRMMQLYEETSSTSPRTSKL